MLNKETVKKWARRIIWFYIAITVVSLLGDAVVVLLASPIGIVVFPAILGMILYKVYKKGHKKLVICVSIIITLNILGILVSIFL